MSADPNVALETNELRKKINGDEAYLVNAYRNPADTGGLIRFGSERRGYITTRHPAGYSATDASGVNVDAQAPWLGYDIGSNQISTSIAFVEDRRGTKGEHVGGKVNSARVRADFNIANQVFTQIGVTVIVPDGGNRGVIKNDNVTFPLSIVDKEEKLRVIKRAPSQNPKEVAVLYVSGALTTELHLGVNLLNPRANEDALGATFSPGSGYDRRTEAGIVLTDQRFSDTFAHELGHFLLGSFPPKSGGARANEQFYRFPSDIRLGDDESHSRDMNELMSAGSRNSPFVEGRKYKDLTTAEGFITKEAQRLTGNLKGVGSLDGSAPAESGRRVGHIGGIDLLGDPVVYEGPASEQETYTDRAMLESSAIAHIKYPNTFGEMVDFAWIEDNRWLEYRDGSDLESSKSEDPDYLIWKTGPSDHDLIIKARNEARKYQFELGTVPFDRTQLPDDSDIYSADYFNVVDVFSIIARFADNDVDPRDQLWSPRASALDYVIEFRHYANGGGTYWKEGELRKLFVKGWTDQSCADDYVARWTTSGGEPAFEVRIKAKYPADQHPGNYVLVDGNTQIDAIVAANTRANISTQSIVYERGFGSGGTDEYRVEMDIVDPDEVVTTFSVTLYGSLDGVTPGEPIRTIQVNRDGGSETGFDDVIFDDVDLSELQGFSSIIVVVNSQNDVTEITNDDNSIKLDIVNTGYGVEIGAVDGVLTNPAGFVFEGGFFHAINGGNGTPSLFRINPSTLATTTLTFVGTGVSGTRNWQDLAMSSDGTNSFLYVADIGANTSDVRILKTPVPDGTTCASNQIVLNAAWPLTQCEYEIIDLNYPGGVGTPDARTLLVDPPSGVLHVITFAGDVYAANGATMSLVSELPFGNVVGGDVSLDGTAVFLKTDTKIYKFPFRYPSHSLEHVFDNYEYWEVPYNPSQPAEDLALDPGGNGFYMIRSSADGNGDFPIWHSQSSRPAATISNATFGANGSQWTLDYTLSDNAVPFAISVYRVEDGEALSPANKVGQRNVTDGDLLEGPQSVTIDLSLFSDTYEDYGLVAMVGNMRFSFAGGAFLSEADTLHVFGGDKSDRILVEAVDSDILVTINGEEFPYDLSEITIANIQARGRGGSDAITVTVSDKTARVFGGGGNDVIDAALAQGTLHGGAGDDILIAGDGIDSLDGGAGDDTYAFTAIYDGAVLADSGGIDTLDFSRMGLPIEINLATATAQVVAGTREITLGSSLIENVIGTDYDDVIIGSQLDNYLSGGLGADTYQFLGETQGHDTIDEFAEVDGDTLFFGGMSSGITIDLSSYEVQNVAGTNGSILKLTLTNPLSVDNVVGTAFADSIIGNDGDNVLEGGAGNDTLDGGGGSDTYVYSGSNVGQDAIIEADVADSDTLDFSGLTTTPSGNGITVNLLAGTVDLYPFGGGISISSPSGIENVIGTTGDDTITGNARANRIEGGLGDDTLAGGRGDDTYVFARETGQHLGLDVIREFGNVDHDTLDYSAAKNARLAVDLSNATSQDVLYEFSGTWVVKGQLRLESIGFGTGKTIEGVVGTDGDDSIVGNVRPNRLEGRGGNDTLDGHNGQDSLGGGDDTYVFARIDNELLGEDQIVEGSYSGYDTLDFSGMNVPVSVDLQITQQWQEVVGNLGSGIVLKIYVPLGSGGVSMPGVDSIEHIIGSPYDDALRGNTLANHIRGGLGDDTIEGRGGNDVLDGGEGSDLYEFRYSSMVGGLGDDILREGEAADSDTLDFSEFYQAVSVNLSSGATVSGVLNLALNRSDGVENVIGTLYGDTLLGNARPNLLIGGAGNDSLSGFEAEDTLEGGEGNDTLDGGAGSDVFRFPRSTSQNLGSDSIIEAADVDSDTLDFSEFLVSGSDGVTVELNTTVSDTVYSSGLVLTLSTATSIENAIGSPGDDTLEGNSRDNILEGRGGDDHLNGYSGNDTYVFSRTDVDDLGSDTIADTGGSLDTIDLSRIDLELDVTPDYGVEAGKFEYTVNLGTIEVLIGGALDDALSGDGAWLIGGPGNDTLTGGSGSDTLEGGEGNDNLIGGGGNDVYRFRRRFFEDLGVDRIFEEIGEGTDLLDFSEFDEALYVDLATENQQRVADRALELILLLGDDASRSEVEDVVGGDFDDVLIGNELGNHLFGGAGDDTLEGGEGNDSLEGGVGDDTYVFRQFASQNPEDLGEDIVSEAPHRGFDLLDFSGFKSGVNVNLAASGMNNVDPTNGNLSLNFVGGEYSLEGLIGTDYADTLTGNKRPNWLEGGKGDDTLSGDLGDDRYVFRVFGGDDLGTDVIQNEVQHGGRDVIDFADFRPSDGLGINGTSGFNLGTLSGSTAQTLHSQLSIRLHTTAVYLESVVGTPFADRLIGNNYANILFGGDGNDTLQGGAGSNTLVGGGGDDSLVGGSGNDTYFFDRTEADDLGHDTVVETASVQIQTLDFSLFGEGITIDLGVGGTAQTIAEGKLVVTLSSATAFDKVIGTPFQDILRGNSGNNVLAGGAGDDRYVFSRSSDSEQMGSDTITDTDGNDTLDFSEFGEGVFTALYNGVPQATNQFQVNRAGSSELTLQVPANQIENVIGSSGDDDINGIGGGTLFGGDGDDTLNAIGDDATLIGGDGDDFLNGDNYRVTLEGGLGNDTLNGEAGETTYVFKRESTDDDLGHDEIIGEAANEEIDTFDFSEFAGSIVLDLNGGTGVNVAAGKLYLTFGSAVIENVIGTAGADTITGNGRPNLIFGGDGADTISGGGGHDTLIGEAGNDSLLGGDGDDVLEGGTGNDVLVGGDGNDAYVFAQTNGENLGSDSITETTNGGDEDALMFNDFGSGVEVYLNQADTLPIVSHGSLTLTLVNRNTIERLEGSEFDDILFADSPDKAWLYGHAGNDTLYAGDATEALLYGGLGDDWLLNDFAGATTMYGEEGNDVLVGGEHSDDLYGGPGDDELVSGASGTVVGGTGHDIVDGQPDSDPSIGSTVDPIAVNFILDPSSQVERGAALSLSLSPVLDSDGVVLYAVYYWDADDDGVLNLAFDRLVGSEVVNGTGVASEVSISTAGLPLGDARFFARVVDSHGLFSEIYEATVEVVDAPPRVQKVYVSSTEWTSEFYSAVGITSMGYFLTTGFFQLRPLPWINVNQIHIQFTKDVIVDQGDFHLYGVNVSEYAIAGFSYDASTYTATWTLVDFLGIDKLRIYLSDDVTDIHGNRLDGEAPSGSNVYPSGNGTAGGVFTFRFNSLPGDVSSSVAPYSVSQTDVNSISSLRGWTVYATSYSSRADLDGNGIIDEIDYILVQQLNPSVLPSGEPGP